MNNKFKIGDRVKCIKGYQHNSDIVGQYGRIMQCDENDNIGVCFDKKIRSGHSLGGNCPDGHGWSVPASYIQSSRHKATSYRITKRTHLVVFGPAYKPTLWLVKRDSYHTVSNHKYRLLRQQVPVLITDADNMTEDYVDDNSKILYER